MSERPFTRSNAVQPAEQRLHELEQSVSRLMRGLNHDLKNPLGAADGYLELMQGGYRGELSQDQQQTIERVRALVGSAVDIVEDVVTFARASLGELGIDAADTDLNAIAGVALEEHRTRAGREQIALKAPNGTAPTRVRTDGRRVTQILRQLLANALDYTPPGGCVELSVNAEDGAALIHVRDSGAGIPEDARERILLPFEQGEPPLRDRQTAGVGFGLALAPALATLLGGELRLESEIGRGSTFTLALPLEPGTPLGAVSSGASERPRGPETPGGSETPRGSEAPRGSEQPRDD